jgi:hypothetical protein
MQQLAHLVGVELSHLAEKLLGQYLPIACLVGITPFDSSLLVTDQLLGALHN